MAVGVKFPRNRSDSLDDRERPKPAQYWPYLWENTQSSWILGDREALSRDITCPALRLAGEKSEQRGYDGFRRIVLHYVTSVRYDLED